ncbi:hypothetical protein V6N11_057778 [Hibiscus sabdariffa]|uniref:Uncharacterized protein n=2 Tax=Hibiscus sabdariffa TaxID=183260 RepID=A0ABR2BEK8_9ROSI
MVAPNGYWKWKLFQHLILHLVLLCIAAIKPLVLLLGSDGVGWRGGLLNRFSVKATYEVRLAAPSLATDNVWEIIQRHRGF